jgi:magnesium transporter
MASSATPTVASIAATIQRHKTERLSQFRALPLETRCAVFEVLTPYVQQAILEQLTTHETLQLLDHFDLQQTENILARMRNTKKRQTIAKRLQLELKEKAEYFLRFHPKAELELLHFNYLLLPASATIKRVAAAVAEHCREVGRVPEVLVHRDGVFLGEVIFADIIERPNQTTLEALVHTVPTVTYQAELSEIVATFTATARGKIVVLDTDGSVVGVVYADDALRLFGHAPDASLYDFAGVDNRERSRDSWWRKVRSRYFWLIINLGTGFLAAGVVSLFEATIDELVLLAMYMPIVAGMGGNAAAQALAITTRGITVGEVTLATGGRSILHEMIAGLVNGLIVGALVAIIASLWNGTPLFGLVVGVAMVANLVVAGFFGTLIPLTMRALGKDPATSATVFTTTATDVFGFFIFLGLASLVLL